MIRNLAICSVALFFTIPSSLAAHSGGQAILTDPPPMVDGSFATIGSKQDKPARPASRTGKLAALDQTVDAIAKNLTAGYTPSMSSTPAVPARRNSGRGTYG